MTRFKQHLISLVGFFCIIFLALLLARPRLEQRFKKSLKREDRLLQTGYIIEKFSFSHTDWEKGFNGATGHSRITFTGPDGHEGKLYIYAHSIQDFTDYSFFQEFFEFQLKIFSIKGGYKATIIDGYRVGDTLSGLLLDEEIPLGPITIRIRLSRSNFFSEDEWLPETIVEFLLGDTSFSPLTLSTKTVYQWNPDHEKILWLGQYNIKEDRFTVRNQFREDLF